MEMKQWINYGADRFEREAACGQTLRAYIDEHGPLQPDAFLTLARAIAAAVGNLHQQSTLHLDLRPEQIRVKADCTDILLHDSDHAVRRTERGYVRPEGSLLLEVNLPYCSPELTGRMLRTVDERSDLYALGVIFYEMLTGSLPFIADDPLEWVYMHLAQSPPALGTHRSDLPYELEEIVMKLLNKNPDNRYTSAAFLIADLDKIGRSQDMVFTTLGFHGREHELTALTEALYSVFLGSTEMVYVSGEAGVGKTSLINEMFRRRQLGRDFFYITGKFEQISKESPYHPIIQAFRDLMRHLLGGRSEQTAQWKMRLQEALGLSASVIAEIIPEVGLLLGGVPAAEELQASESKKRFIYAFRKFIQALASKEHPLVLFIDDLQWADTSSLQLLHALLVDPECQYLLFVCAYRHTEVIPTKLPGYEMDGSVTEQALIRHLHVTPLDMDHMNRLVMETLRSPAASTLSLTEVLYHKSGGNPFHFKQILLRLQDDGALRYSHEKRCWQWDLSKIIEQEPSYAIHDLMVHKLHRLSGGAQELLRVAACLGSTFHPGLVACVARPTSTLYRSEWEDIEAEGLIAPFDIDKYRFAHDHIQKIIYNSIEDSDKQAIHLEIGRWMNGRHAEYGENSFAFVNHLNRGAQQMTDESELLQLARLNLDAGNSAKSSTAYDVALGYFGKGVELLGDQAWNQQFDLGFELYAQKAECEYLCGNAKQSEQEIVQLLRHARNPVERSRIQMLRIMQSINKGKYLEGTALGLESLAELGVIISPNPSHPMLLAEGLRIEILLRNRYERLADLPEMTDKERIAAMNLIIAITPSTFFTNKEVYFLLMCRGIQLSLKYGNTPVSAVVYTAFGMMLGGALGKPDKGYAIGKVGLALSDRYKMTSMKSKTYTMFGGVHCQFAGDAREGDAYLMQALRFGMGSGDYVFASYAIGAHVNSLYIRAPLSELARTIADYMAVLDTTNDEFVRQNFYLYQQFIRSLQGGTDAPDSFSGDGFDETEFITRIRLEETSATSLYQYHTYKTQLCYLLGSYEEAADWAARAEAYAAYATHLPHLPACVFYETLALLAAHTSLPRHGTTRKKVQRAIRRYRLWSSWSPANYLAKLYLLQAELARVSGDVQTAEDRYDQAVREAREQNDIQTASLAGERAAGYYKERGKDKTAMFYLQLAVEGYRQWEVSIKWAPLADQLQQLQSKEEAGRFAESGTRTAAGRSALEQPMGVLGRPSSLSVDSMDLAAILRATQARTQQMDMDTVLTEILHTIMKYAGASKGALLTGSQETLYVQAYADTEFPLSPDLIRFPTEISSYMPLPEGIIRYVFRTQEEVVYNKGTESWLIHNPYMAKHRPQSALCIPVLAHGTILGILYLENRLAGAVFAQDRTAVLQAMASHGLFMCMLQSVPDMAPDEPDAEQILQDQPSPMEEPLTDRELEVLALLAAGLSNKEIADHLIIAVGTVKVHVKNIFAKLKVNRRAKAIAQAQQLKLLGQSK
ncbi:AAA family ATPase [Paenibacillus ferrarius]|uniref:AAA family ATPase n=1 Tax=Paenibacillus ferrarius TaxID=1469647 RepID=UPI003D2C6E14